MNLNHIARNLAAMLFRNMPARFALQVFQPNPVPVDLRLDIAVSGTRDSHSHRTGRAMARQADDSHVQSEVFAAELGAVAGLVGGLKHLLFHLEIPEGASMGIA